MFPTRARVVRRGYAGIFGEDPTADNSNLVTTDNNGGTTATDTGAAQANVFNVNKDVQSCTTCGHSPTVNNQITPTEPPVNGGNGATNNAGPSIPTPDPVSDAPQEMVKGVPNKALLIGAAALAALVLLKR